MDKKIIAEAAVGKALCGEFLGKIRRRDFSAGVPFHTIAPLHLRAGMRGGVANQRDVLYCL